MDKDIITYIIKRLKAIDAETKKMAEKTAGNPKFTIDGKLIGDVGECIATYMFGLTLNKKHTNGYDALKDGCKVEIKLRRSSATEIELSQVTQTYAKNEKVYLVVLLMNKDDFKIQIKYNGLMKQALLDCIDKNNSISLAKLEKMNDKDLKIVHSEVEVNKLISEA